VSGRGGDEAELVKLADRVLRDLHPGMGGGTLSRSTLQRIGEDLEGVPLNGAAVVLDRARREGAAGGRVSEETRAALFAIVRGAAP